MGKMIETNGYRSYSHWNQNLYMGNDVNIYNAMVNIIKEAQERADVLFPQKSDGRYKYLLSCCTNRGWRFLMFDKTPDGVKYNRSGVNVWFEGALNARGEFSDKSV